MSARSVIVAGARTPIGRFGGAFRDLAAVDLGGAAIRAALERAALAGADVDYVVMGQALPAAVRRHTAPPGAHRAAGPPPAPALTGHQGHRSRLQGTHPAVPPLPARE